MRKIIQGFILPRAANAPTPCTPLHRHPTCANASIPDPPAPLCTIILPNPQVWHFIARQGASVYISGSAQKMPADVASALEAVAVQHGGLGAEAAAKWVRQLETSGRYFVEAWS